MSPLLSPPPLLSYPLSPLLSPPPPLPSSSPPPSSPLSSGSKRKPFISLDQLMDFINQLQRDSRLNEVLYPPLKREQIRQIMEKYESNASQLERGGLVCVWGGYCGWMCVLLLFLSCQKKSLIGEHEEGVPQC